MSQGMAPGMSTVGSLTKGSHLGTGDDDHDRIYRHHEYYPGAEPSLDGAGSL
jgi:hypothetical protein